MLNICDVSVRQSMGGGGGSGDIVGFDGKLAATDICQLNLVHSIVTILATMVMLIGFVHLFIKCKRRFVFFIFCM